MSLSYQWIPFVLSAVILFSGGSCSEENEPRAPEISSFEPAGAVAGAQVVVTGNHFSSTPGDNTVMFNGAAASIVSATKTQLTVTVPAAATTGKISVTSGTLTATSANDFELLKDIPRDGLVCFYTFNGGDALDNSGHNLHGTVNGATLTADRFGNSDDAYQFDGVDDFITMGNPVELQISESITVSAWVKIDEFEDYMAILSKGDSQTGSPEGYVLQLSYQSSQTGPGYRFYVLGNQTGIVKTAINFVEGEWVFLAFGTNTTSYRFFIDQSKSIAGNGYKPLTSGLLGDFVLGRDENGANHLKGAVDDVIVYNRLLTQDEILQLYAQTVSKY